MDGDGPKIAVVGAGLAGLTCAYRLTQAGLPCSVFEARDRLGGRCWTARELHPEQVAEHGGEFIAPDHARIRALIDELGLPLEPCGPNLDGTYVDAAGAPIAIEAVDADFPAFAEAVARFGREVGAYRAGRATDAARVADSRSVDDWLDAEVGTGPPVRALLDTVFTDMFGAPPDRLSALMVLELFGWVDPSGDEPLSLFGVVREATQGEEHVAGGNDRIVTELARRLPAGTIATGAPLEAIRRGDDGVRLRIGDVGEVDADLVVLALPFSTLRHVDLDDAGFDPELRAFIEELQMGTNTKCLLALDRRVEELPGWGGFAGTTEDHVFTWNSTYSQSGDTGILTMYTGERVFEPAPDTPHGPPPPGTMTDVARRLGTIVDGTAPEALTGAAWLDSWPDDPWARGSYAAFAPGQVTRWWGAAERPDGPIHFAGEHTSTAAQGYLEGAVESGERAAREVVGAAGA
jgi:monoamine oxidase